MEISETEAMEWARAASRPETQIEALAHGLEEWTRMQRWIAKFGSHPRVIAWLENNPPPAKWRESPQAWAYTEMLLPPGMFDK